MHTVMQIKGHFVIVVTSFSEAGGHLENEDAYEIVAHPTGPDYWLCFLADGQGGQAGGAEAARLACRTAAGLAVREGLASLRDPDVWESMLGEADRAVEADRVAGFTTLAGFLIAPENVCGASCGDSAVVMVPHRTGEPARELTRGQWKNPPVGSGAARFVPFSAGLSGPWSVLAISDGVWKAIAWDRLVQAARDSRGRALIEALSAPARSRRTGRFADDFTVIVLEWDA